MTLHVIDTSRPLPPTKGDYEIAFSMESGDTLILGQGAEIAAYGYGANALSGGWGSVLLIDGRVHSEYATGIHVNGTINVGATGSVSGRDAGLHLAHDYNLRTNVVTNAGTISGLSAGIYLDGSRAAINNTGSIVGDTAIYHYSSYDPGENLVINNTGLLSGTSGTAINGAYYGPNIVTNKGRIEGDVVLGIGNDIYDGRGGTATGMIFLWQGDDVAYGGDGAETFFASFGNDFVDGGAGTDTLLLSVNGLGSWVNYTVDLKVTERQQTGLSSWIVLRNVENLVGGAWADNFIGNKDNNVFVGAGGRDILDGDAGNDILNGGRHNDELIGGEGSDIAVFSGKFSDYTITTDTDGKIVITDNRASGDDSDRLAGVEFALFNDMIFTLPVGTSSPSVPTVPSASSPTPPGAEAPVLPPVPAIKNFKLTGGKKAETFVGGKGHDMLNGGLGRDKLTGGEGHDVFVFSTKIGKTNVDRVTDFNSAEDTFQLSKAVFGKIQKGLLSKSAFCLGTKACDSSDRIIFDKKTGDLFYDADGSGKKFKAVKFAKLQKETVLGADDFWIV